MKPNIFCFLFLLLCPFTFVQANNEAFPISVGRNKDSNCNEGELIAFSCHYKKKLYSLCASSNLDAKAGYLHYRVTQNGKHLLELPNGKSQHPRGYFEYTTGMSNAMIRFKNEGYTYIIDVDVSPNALIKVLKGEKKLTEFKCRHTAIDAGLDRTWTINLLKQVGIYKERF